MSAESGHFLASPYGGAFAVGNDDADVWGGLTGTEIGEAYGVGGLGLVGTGRGGGGTGEGTDRPRQHGPHRQGRRRRHGLRLRPRRRRRLRRPRHPRPHGPSGQGRGPGALDKDIIRPHRSAPHINEVRYCYKQALARDPNAKGRVAVQFTIGGTGKVPTAVVAGEHDEGPGRRLLHRPGGQALDFPKPEGGGSVIVSYPFVLEPSVASPAVLEGQPVSKTGGPAHAEPRQRKDRWLAGDLLHGDRPCPSDPPSRVNSQLPYAAATTKPTACAAGADWRVSAHRVRRTRRGRANAAHDRADVQPSSPKPLPVIIRTRSGKVSDASSPLWPLVVTPALSSSGLQRPGEPQSCPGDQSDERRHPTCSTATTLPAPKADPGRDSADTYAGRAPHSRPDLQEAEQAWSTPRRRSRARSKT